MEHVDPDQLRKAALTRLSEEPLDLLVIGGGIVGAGVARDAAMRGLRTGLVEQHDLAYGTSSRSSRLLHGGIRYLAQGRLGLVREASREKRVLARIAPHLAEPLAFVFPTFRKTPWRLWKLRIAVKMYDFLCGGHNFGPSSAMDRDAVLAHLPGLADENLTGAVRYYDGLTNDSRLVLDTLRSAAAHGAIVSNYTRLEEASPHGDKWRCRVRDVLSGRSHELHVRAVVNATGPWSPSLPHARIRLRLTKGVHLVIDRERLPVPDAVVVQDGRRILFAIPWSRRVILGTTDTDYDGPPEAVQTEPADVEYVLRIVNRFFPSARLSPEDVRATWAGLRPLLARRRGKPSDITRAHKIRMPHPGWFDVAGGKLTTYRLIGQQVVNRVVKYLESMREAGIGGRRLPKSPRLRKSPSGPWKRDLPPCRTAAEPLLEPEAVHDISGIVPPEPSPELIVHFCRNEWAVHLDDIMLRRAGWHYYRDDRQSVAGQVARWMSDIFGWDREREARELARYRQEESD